MIEVNCGNALDDGLGMNVDDVESCLLEDDMQCGHVFFNETTRVLKFYCTYCRLVSENIHYFCQHLSEHINDEDEDEIKAEPESDDEAAGRSNSASTSTKAYDVPVVQPNLLPADLAGFDESKMVVEELDEAEEIAAEVRQELESEHTFFKDENSCSNDFFGYAETPPPHSLQFDDPFTDDEALTPSEEQDVPEVMKASTDFENLIDTARTAHIQLTPVGKRTNKKRRKVTTVKVIALKNRVAELYARIKSEELKRSKNTDSAWLENGLSTSADEAVSSLADNALAEKAEFSGFSGEPPGEPMVRKIIGETVITLLPQSQTQQQLGKFPSNPVATFPPSEVIHRRDDVDDKTVCPACGKKFRSAFSLTIHKRTHYLETTSSIKLAHKCSDCDQLFNKITDLKDHIQEVHYPQGFICRICGRKLTSLTLLEAHMLRVHLSRPFNCQICRKNFDTRDRYEEHVTSHVSGQHYKCHMCGRKYSTECILKQHQRRHKERVPQCCVVCGKLTLRITQHMKIHAPRPKRILSCKVCGKVFNFSSGLSHHFKIKHKFPRSPPKSKKRTDNTGRPITRSTQEETTDEELGYLETEVLANGVQEILNNSTDILEKEEEAKRVIVELIQNATYKSFLPDNFSSALETGPPIAREETISAVNSIVNDD